MNERIRELALLSEGTKKHVPSVWQFYDHELEKFAELIVKETLNELCVQMDHFDIDLSNLPRWYKALEKAEQHFGVE